MSAHACALQPLGRGAGIARDEPLREQDIELVAMPQAGFGRGKARVARGARLIQLAHQRLPFGIISHGQGQPPIGLLRGVHAVRRHR